MNLRAFILISLALMMLSSCGKDVDGDNDQEIKDYIHLKGYESEMTSSGLHYVIDEPGTTDKLDVNSTVTVHYTGFYLDDSVFDSTDGGDPATFPLANTIEGWIEGIPLFGKGGRGTLFIPSRLGYGSSPPSGVREDAVLIFDIQLLDFN